MQDYSLSVEAANLKSVSSGACISNVVYSTNFDYFMIFFSLLHLIIIIHLQ